MRFEVSSGGIVPRPLVVECVGSVKIQVELSLRHNRQGEVVAGTASVVDLEVVAVAGEGRAVGQVTEPAHNGRRRGVVNHSENCARRQRAGRKKIAEDKSRAALNRHALGGNLSRCNSSAIQCAFIGRVGVERQRIIINGQSAWFSRTVSG